MEVDDRTYNPIVSYENAEQKPEFNPKDGYEAPTIWMAVF